MLVYYDFRSRTITYKRSPKITLHEGGLREHGNLSNIMAATKYKKVCGYK